MNESFLIDRAMRFATAAHGGQTRKFGEPPRPYIYHPGRVFAYLLPRCSRNASLLAAAWLHDVTEDCGVTPGELEATFNADVARLVSEVSHPATPIGLPRRERWPIYLEHYASASPDGRRLKLADRLCNLREYIDFWSEVPAEERAFIRGVYRDETLGIAGRLSEADPETAGSIVLAVGRLMRD